MSSVPPPSPTAVEFFAGIGLMRLGLERAGIKTLWANDIDPAKEEMYVANFGEREFVLADIRDIEAREIPSADIATGSFPCIDLSLAGKRQGLGRRSAPKDAYWESSMFWEFARLLGEMGTVAPESSSARTSSASPAATAAATWSERYAS